MTVGTQAAVLAGLDITMFIEFNPPEDHTWVRTWLIAEYFRRMRPSLGFEDIPLCLCSSFLVLFRLGGAYDHCL